MIQAQSPAFARRPGILLLTVVAAAIVCLALTVAAHTPRGRLNVMQVAAVMVFVVSAFRFWKASEQAATERPQRSAVKELAPALIAGTLVWAPMLPFYFISEDFEHLMAARQPMLPSLVELTTRGQLGAFLRPVGFFTIFVDYRLFGESPIGYHITNLAIHLLTAVALYYLCVYAEAPAGLAGRAALIYTLLPVHVEAAAWMGARFDLLSACLATWALALYMKFRKDQRWRTFALCLVTTCLAILSKENAFAIALLVLAAELLLFKTRRFAPALAVVAVTALLFGYRWLILGGVGGYADTAGNPQAFNFGLKTLEGLLVRAPSIMLLGYNWIQPAGFAFILVVGLTAALLVVAAWVARPERDGRALLLFGFAWAVCASAPAHTFLFIDASLMNSRVLHFGSVGMALFAAQLLQGISGPRDRRFATALLAGLLAAGVLHNLTAWGWTSHLSKDVLRELRVLDPKPLEGTRYVFHDLPLSIRGVYFLRSALADAVRVTYGRDDLSGDRSGAPLPSGTPVVHIQWKGERPPLIERIGPRPD